LNESAPTDSNNNICDTFLLRRYAQLYAEKFMKENHHAAEMWVRQNVHKEDRKHLQPYILKELVKQGFTGIIA